MKSPVFVISTTGRSGSTLVMRLLNTHPDLWMWGEAEDVVRALLQVEGARNLRAKQSSCDMMRLRHDGVIKGWYPNILPVIDNAAILQTTLPAIFKQPGHTFWGFKTIFSEPHEVEVMQRAFPEAAFLLLRRDIETALPSINRFSAWKHMDTDKWRERYRQMTSFFDSGRIANACQIDYDAMCADRVGTTARIEAYLEIEPGLLNQEVFTHVVRC
jgi:hypothetical protein